MAKRGRPKKYDKTFPERARALAEEGLYEWEIAGNLGITQKALIDYKRDYSEFSEAIKRGQFEAIKKVENALYNRAMGSKTLEIKEETELGIIVKTTKIQKAHPGDTTAMIFFLKNRCPDRWKDRQEVEHSGEIGVMIVDDIND